MHTPESKWPLLAIEFNLSDHRITDVTNRLCLKFQKTPNELLEQRLDELLSPASRFYFLSAMQTKLQQGIDCEQVTLYFKTAAGNAMCLCDAICQGDDKVALTLIVADRHLLLERQLISERDETKSINNELIKRQHELTEQKEEKVRLLTQMELVTAELLQTEKLAALGQMAAGIAHEINNPVGYIQSNLNTLSQYAQRLVNLIHRAGVPDEQKTAADFEFLEDDLLSLLNETQEGVQRITQITRSLTQFTRRSGLSDWCDVHQQIDTTLKIMKNELRGKVEIRRQFAELPEIYCDPAQVNQVLLNVLLNAAHAIERFGYIDIVTELSDDKLIIKIADTGCGMDGETAKRALDPFFTTKPEGDGTGLGLSISYSIMRSIGGDLTLNSEQGKGTEVTLSFPASLVLKEGQHGS